jgi:hypothetical protein
VLQQFDPRVAQYPGWFQQFRRAVLELMQADENGPLQREDNDNEQ